MGLFIIRCSNEHNSDDANTDDENTDDASTDDDNFVDYNCDAISDGRADAVQLDRLIDN